MSGRIVSEILNRYSGMGSERMVAVVLGDPARDDGTNIFPSVATIAARAKLTARSVQVQLAIMVASGWLVLVHKSTGRRGDTNVYRISPSWLAGGECMPPSGPVLRTNAKRTVAQDFQEIPADEPPPQQWGELHATMGCTGEQHGMQPNSPKPSTTVISNTPPTPSEGAGGFDYLAAEYPRRAGIEAARRQWDALAPDAALERDIVGGIRAWKRSEEWQRENGRYIPKLARFLRDRRWLDAPSEPTSAASNSPLPRATPLSPQEMAKNKERAKEALAYAKTLFGEKKLK